MYWYGDVIRPFGKLGMAVVALLVLTPPALISIFAPPAVDLTVTKTSTEYDFRSLAYAQEFADLNGSIVE